MYSQRKRDSFCQTGVLKLEGGDEKVKTGTGIICVWAVLLGYGGVLLVGP